MARGGTLPPRDTGGAPLPALERLKALERAPPRTPWRSYTRGRAPARETGSESSVAWTLALIRGRASARGNIQLKVTSLFGILSAHEV